MLFVLPGLLARPHATHRFCVDNPHQATRLHRRSSAVWPVVAACDWSPRRRRCWEQDQCLRMAESSFWSLNSLAIEPVYVHLPRGDAAACRKSLFELAGLKDLQLAPASVFGHLTRGSGAVVMFGAATAVAMACLAEPRAGWPDLTDLASPHRSGCLIALANSVVLVACLSGDRRPCLGVCRRLTMPQPRDFGGFSPRPAHPDRTWRIAHLSDIHVVGEPLRLSDRERSIGSARQRFAWSGS